jgi:DNA-binding NtrC family response regulator
MQPTILIAEDEPSQRFTFREFCKQSGYDVIEASDGEEAYYFLTRDETKQIHLLLTDLNMPKMGGMELTRQSRSARPDVPVIVLTMSTDMQDAVNAMQAGAHDFITKPVDPERLRVSIANALQNKSLRAEVVRLTRQSKGGFGFDDLIGADGGLKDAVEMGRRLASSDLPVLITGESGVGKEVFARAIHGESKRADAPYIAMNCGAIPANLAESILFGHEKGSFTGAIAKSLGKFREAQGGTLFLDEIGELPGEVQAKLLRAIQNKEIEPVGYGKSVPIDVRIISATHRDLRDDVASGRFREDLFYRLNVLPLHLAALRERRSDIAPLVHYFVDHVAVREGVKPRSISREAMELLMQHPWPGNVRELENCIARALLLAAGDEITHHDIAPLLEAHGRSTAPVTGGDVVGLLHENGQRKTMQELEAEIITHTLAAFNQVVPKAAAMLGIGQSTIYRKLAERDRK